MVNLGNKVPLNRFNRLNRLNQFKGSNLLKTPISRITQSSCPIAHLIINITTLTASVSQNSCTCSPLITPPLNLATCFARNFRHHPPRSTQTRSPNASIISVAQRIRCSGLATRQKAPLKIRMTCLSQHSLSGTLHRRHSNQAARVRQRYICRRQYDHTFSPC